jgi:hypothetical protein
MRMMAYTPSPRPAESTFGAVEVEVEEPTLGLGSPSYSTHIPLAMTEGDLVGEGLPDA